LCGLDSTKLTFGEWWRVGPGLTAIVGWCAGLLRTRILDAMRLLVVRDSAALEIPMENLSDEVRRKVFSQVEALRALGFGEPRAMHVTDVFLNREVVLAVQLHSSGRTVSRTIYAYPLPGAVTKKTAMDVGFLTGLADGRMLCTDTKRPKFLSSPRVLGLWKAGSLAAQYKAHEENITQAGCEALPLTSEKVWTLCDAYENELTSFGHSRGLLVPLSEAEGAKVLVSASPEEARLAATLSELARLQTARPRSIAPVILLVLSLAIFAWIGALSWSWEICAIIGTALLVHEFGHYVAMRWFKYRDLRMFFIPLLGAAVTGKNDNVAGWKKAVVYLMGPLPGIVFGTGMAVAAIVLETPAVAKAALLVIGLNLFNLLPILPLDGGGFWNAVLFCRHPRLEAGFKSLAGVCLLACGLAGGIWFVLGISMLMGVPKTLRLGTAAQRLRQKGWQPAVGERISREAAETILAELKQTAKSPPAARTAAAEALNVFEHLNARPPSMLTSFGLAASYAVAVFVALVGLGTAAFSVGGGSRKFSETSRNSAVDHTTLFNAEFHGEVARFSAATPSSGDEPQSHRRLIATFPDAKGAGAVLEKIREEKIAVDEVVQFGQTLIAVTALEDEATANELAERFRLEGGTVPGTGEPLSFTLLNLQFSARDAQTAARLSRELHAYFGLPVGMRPPAPWVHDPAIKPEQREQSMHAAATYARILEAQSRTDESPELNPLRRSTIFNVFQSPDAARAKLDGLVEKRHQLHREAVKKMRASGDPTLDERVIALVLRKPKLVMNQAQFEAIEKWQGEMRELLTGHRENEREMARDEYMSARVVVNGQQITLQFLSFPAPEQTLPALAQYFEAFDCYDVRYGFYDSQTPDAPRLAAMDR
jgi:Zn-dependent protease